VKFFVTYWVKLGDKTTYHEAGPYNLAEVGYHIEDIKGYEFVSDVCVREASSTPHVPDKY
jgi:hypothetical protein